MAFNAHGFASCGGCWPCKEACLVPNAGATAGRRLSMGRQHTLCKFKQVIETRAHDNSSPPVLVSSEEYDDGTVMFSFGDEADAKSAAAPSTAPHAEQDNSTSPVKQQAVQGAALASQEQSQTHDAKSQNQSSPKQDLANSSVHNLQQSAPAVPQQMTASTAEQAATFPLSDEQIIAKESSRTVDSDLLASGSAVRSGSNADARKSVSKAPSQRPSTSKPPIDAKTIAKYSHQAINPDLSAAASSTGASTSSVDTTKPASASSQRPSSTKPAIDPKIIAKYSRRSVTTALPASGSTGTSGSNVDAVKSVSNTSSQHPRSPAFGSTGPSSSDGDMSKSVSSQTPASPKPPIDDKIIAKYSGGAISPDLPAPGSTGPTGLKADTTKSGSKASKQRPASPQAPIDTKSVSKASSQRPASSKPPKPSREVVILDPPASKSESAEAETSVDTSDRTARGSESASERLGGMTPQQLEGLKVAELKSLCKQEQITGYSKLKKDQLISRLQEQLQTNRG